MAEPARKIYDEDNSQPAAGPDLKALEGGGETSEPHRGHLQAVDPEKSSDSKDLDKAEKEAANEPETSSQHENPVGGGYSKSGGAKKSLRQRLSGRRKRTLIAGGIAAILIAVFIAAFSFLFLPLKILHIVNNLQSRFYGTAENAMDKEVDKLLSRYVAKKIRLGGCTGSRIDHTCNPFNAGDSLVTRLYRGWSNGRLEDRLWDKHGIRVKINRPGGAGGVANYELQLKNQSIGIGLRDNFINGEVTLDDVLRTEGNFSADRNQIRQVYLDAVKKESRYVRTWYRVKVSRLLAAKYGIKLCVVGCFGADKKLNDWRNWKDNKKRAYKMYLSDRILKPRAQIFGAMVDCMLTPGACEDILNAKPGPYAANTSGCTNSCTDGGEPMSNTERNRIRANLLRILATQFDSDPVRLKAVYDDIYKAGFSKYIAGSILERITGVRSRDAGQGRLGNAASFVLEKSDKAIPIIGQIILAAQLVDIINRVPQLIPKLVYIANSTAMAEMYTMYRTHADEIKEGNVDSEIVGTFVDSLGPGDHSLDDSGEAQIGGTAGAEATPLYGALIGNTETKTSFSSPIVNLLSPKASAAADPYLCKDNGGSENPVPAGQLTCPEFDLRSRTRLATLKSITDSLGEFWNVLVFAANLINGVVGAAISALISAVGFFLSCPPTITIPIPFADDIEVPNPVCEVLKRAIEPAVTYLLDQVVGLGERFIKPIIAVFADLLEINANLISSNMSGGRTFDLMAGGADITGNEYANHGLGGVVLSEQQLADNLRYRDEIERREYQQKSFFARMFDTESERSPVSKLALAMPSSAGAATGQMTSFLSNNPFASVLSSLGNLFHFGPKADAFTTKKVVKDPFGVLQYGYPLDDPIFKEDPDDYWNNNCTTDGNVNLTTVWNTYAAAEESRDPITFMPTNRKPSASTAAGAALARISPNGTNGCLLIQAAVGSAGAIFTDEVLSPEELADSGSSSGGGGSGGCSTTLDQSPGTPPSQYAAAIAAAAQSLSNPECKDQFADYISRGTPSDGRQYFASCSDNCVPSGGEIRVKYRNPPNAGNTLQVKVN